MSGGCPGENFDAHPWRPARPAAEHLKSLPERIVNPLHKNQISEVNTNSLYTGQQSCYVARWSMPQFNS